MLDLVLIAQWIVSSHYKLDGKCHLHGNTHHPQKCAHRADGTAEKCRGPALLLWGFFHHPHCYFGFVLMAATTYGKETPSEHTQFRGQRTKQQSCTQQSGEQWIRDWAAVLQREATSKAEVSPWSINESVIQDARRNSAVLSSTRL